MLLKGVIIEARTSSKRLFGKTIKRICGRPTIQLMIERVKRIKGINKIILATSTNKCDKILVNIAKKEGIDFFCGSEEDVLSRVLQAAKKFSIDTIISLPGDCTLIDPNCVESVINVFDNNNYDYVSSALSNTFPLGMEAQVYKRSVLEKVDKLTKNPLDREHVTLYIYKNPKKFRIKKVFAPRHLARPDLSLVLDDKNDFLLIKKIFENLYQIKPDFSLQDIIYLLEKNPKLININRSVKRTIINEN